MAAQNSSLISIKISALVHATENIGKVSVALRNILKSIFEENAPIVESHFKGHHGNPIAVLKLTVKKRIRHDRLMALLAKQLEPSSSIGLQQPSQLDTRTSKTFLLRFDKEAAYSGFIKFGQENIVLVELKIASPYAHPELKLTKDR